MCLAITDTKKPKSSGFGYKVFKVHNEGKLTFAFVGDDAPRRQWLKADGGGGFHIYTEQKKAEENVRWYEHLYRDGHGGAPIYKVFKIEYRQATQQGTGDGGFTENAQVVVAQEIYIIY